MTEEASRVEGEGASSSDSGFRHSGTHVGPTTTGVPNLGEIVINITQQSTNEVIVNVLDANATSQADSGGNSLSVSA